MCNIQIVLTHTYIQYRHTTTHLTPHTLTHAPQQDIMPKTSKKSKSTKKSKSQISKIKRAALTPEQYKALWSELDQSSKDYKEFKRYHDKLSEARALPTKEERDKALGALFEAYPSEPFGVRPEDAKKLRLRLSKAIAALKKFIRLIPEWYFNKNDMMRDFVKKIWIRSGPDLHEYKTLYKHAEDMLKEKLWTTMKPCYEQLTRSGIGITHIFA